MPDIDDLVEHLSLSREMLESFIKKYPKDDHFKECLGYVDQALDTITIEDDDTQEET